MFSDIEEIKRKELIKIYEKYLANPNSEEVKKEAEGMGIIGGPYFSEDINLAAEGIYKIETGRMSKEEAKKILEKLKKADREDKETK